MTYIHFDRDLMDSQHSSSIDNGTPTDPHHLYNHPMIPQTEWTIPRASSLRGGWGEVDAGESWSSHIHIWSKCVACIRIQWGHLIVADKGNSDRKSQKMVRVHIGRLLTDGDPTLARWLAEQSRCVKHRVQCLGMSPQQWEWVHHWNLVLGGQVDNTVALGAVTCNSNCKNDGSGVEDDGRVLDGWHSGRHALQVKTNVLVVNCTCQHGHHKQETHYAPRLSMPFHKCPQYTNTIRTYCIIEEREAQTVT